MDVECISACFEMSCVFSCCTIDPPFSAIEPLRYKLPYIFRPTLYIYIYSIYIYIYISGGPLSALTCCVNVRLLSGDKKNIAVNLFSKLGWELGLYYASYDDFHPDILARMYT